MQLNIILIMIKNLKYILTLSFLKSFIFFNAKMLRLKGDLVDGISAVKLVTKLF